MDTPYTSNFYCHPGKAEGSPNRLAEFETAARTAGLADYRVLQPDASGKGWEPVHGRDEYVPVLFSWPENYRTAGLDMSFDPQRMASKLQSRVIGQPVASRTFEIMKGGMNRPGELPVDCADYAAPVLAIAGRVKGAGVLRKIHVVPGGRQRAALLVRPVGDRGQGVSPQRAADIHRMGHYPRRLNRKIQDGMSGRLRLLASTDFPCHKVLRYASRSRRCSFVSGMRTRHRP